MTKQILVIKDPEKEVGFDVVCDYARAVAEYMKGENVVVLPLWPHGEVELIGDKRKMKLFIKEYKKLLDELDIQIGENE